MFKEGLCFDDILIIPQYSEVASRSQVDVSVQINNFKFNHGIIPANMKTVSSPAMSLAVINSGGLALLHRFMSIEEQLDIAKKFISLDADHFGVSIGIKESEKENIHKFMNLGVKILCMDIAHGDSKQCVDMICWIKNNYPDVLLISGNVATASGARRAWQAGADVIRVGVGNGSTCSTRIETAAGVPQLTALMDCFEVKQKLDSLSNSKHYILADGGMKCTADVVKSFCFADLVMSGNLFAGCQETPGELIQRDGKTYKAYVGSSTHKTTHIEGVQAQVLAKGSFQETLDRLLQGLRSGCSYQGAFNLQELKENAQFMRITNAGLIESHPHDVILK